MGISKNPNFIPTDGTTDTATSHLTSPAKDAGQVIGYSHSTDETPSHSTRLSKNDNQVAGYAALRKKFLACISNICGAKKFFSSGQPKGYPTLKLRFLAYILAICGASIIFSRLAFGRTLNF
jgi:hypothetical protein